MDDEAELTRRGAIAAGGAVVVAMALPVGPLVLADATKLEGTMITLFERNTVADYATWAKAFADFAPDLKAAGAISSVVYQSADNPENITVALDFATLEEAKAFLASPELKAARPGAGVATSPTVWFTTRVIANTY